MESQDPKPPPKIRGRARGRAVPAAAASAQPPSPPSSGSPPEVQAAEAAERQQLYANMFGGDEQKKGETSKKNGNNGNGGTRGANGGGRRGSDGSSRGNGGGSDAESTSSGSRAERGSPTDSSRGGIPRGGVHSESESGNGNGNGDVEVYAADYVHTRPVGFDKKGTTGNRVNMIANYFVMTNHPKFNMSLYVVKIDPVVEEEKKIRALVRSKRDEIGPYMLSGYQLFTTFQIKPEVVDYAVTLEGDATPYNVKLDFKRFVSKHNQVVLQFHNILVRQIQRGLNYELLGRHYFDHTKKTEFRSWKLELWPGFQNSIRQQETSLMLNVESVWKVVKTDNVLQIIKDIKQREGPGPNYERKCREAVIGLSVITLYNRKPYRIDDIDFSKAPNNTFPRTRRVDGVEQTVNVSFADYYKDRYDITVGEPGQPMLISKPTKRDERRGQIGDILLVPEFCNPCGLSDELRNNFRLMKELASCLHMEPTKRVTTMTEFIKSLHQNETLKSSMKNWGLKVAQNPVALTGRVLPTQELWMGNNKKVVGNEKADWTMALRGVQMLTSVPLVKWALIVTARDAQNVASLVSTMQKVASPLGYQIRQPDIIRINDTRTDAFIKGINEAVQKFNGTMDMIFVVLANNNLDTYGQVKRRCSKDYGIPSQCFLSKNLGNKGLMSICTKMVIQMNAKQGGEPWGVNNPLKTAMVLGYDVHHAGAGGGMSVGAMTATVSPTLGRYYSCIEKLPDRQEIANTVAKMFEKCLRAYAKMNEGNLPDRIMMYRDGVGEGQLKDVTETEVKGFEAKIEVVYAELGKKPESGPKFTYIIVNKRINTRLFQNQANGQYSNPLPGTIVDDTVTRPERYDFFLVSQIARQGCVSPTYYNVIRDTSGLSADKMQTFTYRLCHLYYNWSGTVAVPGPCQNAHKYALQAGIAMKAPAHRNLEYLLHFL